MVILEYLRYYLISDTQSVAKYLLKFSLCNDMNDLIDSQVTMIRGRVTQQLPVPFRAFLCA